MIIQRIGPAEASRTMNNEAINTESASRQDIFHPAAQHLKSEAQCHFFGPDSGKASKFASQFSFA